MNPSLSSRPPRRWRSRGLIFLVTLVVLLVAGEAFKHRSDRQLLHRYAPSTPLVESVQRVEEPGWMRESFVFEGYDGDLIPVTAALPPPSDTRVPAVVFLYGAGMTTRFADQVGDLFTDRGFALFMPEQFGQGQRAIEHESGLHKVLNARRRVLITGAEARRLLDVLAARPDMDPNRIYFVGTSLGGIIGCHAVAADPRFQAAALVLTGGDFSRWIQEEKNSAAPSRARRFTLRLIKWLIGSADPIHTIGQLSPRPVLLLNSPRDEMIPESAALALYAAAEEPKELRWVDVSHQSATSEEVRRMLNELLDWLTEQDRPHR